MEDVKLPNIGSGKETAEPVANFLHSEPVYVDPLTARQIVVQIPPLYYWETVEDGHSVLMTAAFQWHGMNFGESCPIEDDNFVKIEIMRKKLVAKVRETMDVLVHHGESVLDASRNIDPRKVMDQEAIRYKYDPTWDKKVAAFNQLVRVAPITRDKAVKLGLLPKPNV